MDALSRHSKDHISVHSFQLTGDDDKDKAEFENRKLKKVEDWIEDLKKEIIKEANDMDVEVSENDLKNVDL